MLASHSAAPLTPEETDMHRTQPMILTGLLLGTFAFAQQPGRVPSPTLLKGVSPQQALKLANTWRAQGGCKAT